VSRVIPLSDCLARRCIVCQRLVAGAPHNLEGAAVPARRNPASRALSEHSRESGPRQSSRPARSTISILTRSIIP